MSNIRSSAIIGQKVLLQIQYYDSDENKFDPDETPEVRILDEAEMPMGAFSSRYVTKVGEGLYQFEYEVPEDATPGDWTDEWQADIGGAMFGSSFNFTVVTAADVIATDTGKPAPQLGDIPESDWQPEEIIGVNMLLQKLKARLRSTGKKYVKDEFGKIIYDSYGEPTTVDCDVFSNEILISFLCQSLSEFNSTPFFTAYSFSDQIIKTLFSQIIVEGAYIYAIASQSLLEKGRDFTVSDGGINYTPPQLGDFLQSHYGTWLTTHKEAVKFIKNSIRPGPQSFGSYTNLSSGAPAFNRLRHLRARRIY